MYFFWYLSCPFQTKVVRMHFYGLIFSFRIVQAWRWYTKTGHVRTTWHWGALVQPMLHWKSNNYYIFWVSVCSLRYTAWNAHALYCHLWPDRLQYFSTFSHTRHDFLRKLWDINCFFRFSLQLLSETFLFLRRNERSVITNVRKSSCKVPAVILFRF